MAELDLKQAKKAISALYKYQASKNNSNDLLDEQSDQGVFITMSTHTIKNTDPSLKQKNIYLKHSPYVEGIEICLITKNKIEEVEASIKKNNIPFITKVINPLLLKTTYKAYEAKRKLAASYDMFLIDDRIAHLTPSLVGSTFIKKNQIPVPVKVDGHLKRNVERIVKSTIAKSNASTFNSVLIGHLGMKQSEILDNYEVAMPQLVTFLAGVWKSVNVVALKTSKSPLLPVICNMPQEENKEEKKETKKEAKKEEKKEAKKEEKKEEQEVKKGKKKEVKKEVKKEKEAPKKVTKPVTRAKDVKQKATKKVTKTK